MGLPWEVVTHQGTNFTSWLLSEVYGLLGIKKLRTSVCHPQVDRLVEGFNWILKEML